jgi:hypothetical protein
MSRLCQYLHYVVSNDVVNDEWWKVFGRKRSWSNRDTVAEFAWRYGEDGVHAEIRTDSLPNTRLGRYRYTRTIQLGAVLFVLLWSAMQRTFNATARSSLAQQINTKHISATRENCQLSKLTCCCFYYYFCTLPHIFRRHALLVPEYRRF